MKFFVYIHRRATDNTIFYIGKGCRYRHNSKYGRSVFWHNTVKKYGYTIEIVKSGLTENEAFDLEIELIKKYKHENLCNHTTGGKGSPGVKILDKTRKIFASQRSSYAWRKNISEKAKERFKDPEFLAAHIERIKKRNADPAYRKRISEKIKIINNTPERKKALSAVTANYFKDPANRAYASRKARERFNTAEKRAAHVQAKTVLCVENKMIFGTGTLAAEWIRSQGKYCGDHSSIAKVCRGKKKSAYGYTWRYVTDSTGAAGA